MEKNIIIDKINTMGKSSMQGFLGIEITDVGDDFLAGKMPVDERTTQPFGFLHGGASVVLAETLGSIASFLRIDTQNQAAFGLEINANHIRSVKTGSTIYAKATALHLGKSTHIWDIKISDAEEKLVCVCRFTAAVVDKR